MSSAQPPLMLIYLLSRIPESRRVALDTSGRIGIGLIHRRTRSLAIVSVPSPWRGRADWCKQRNRWRLDSYGGHEAAAEMKRVLADWRALQNAGRTELRMTAWGRGRALRLRFQWLATSPTTH